MSPSYPFKHQIISIRILLAPDKFKGSVSAQEVCEALSEGLTSVLTKVENGKPASRRLDIQHLPLADGGDGTLEVLASHLHLTELSVDTVDPLGRPIEATYLVDNHRAFIEVASASGLVLLDATERNPMHTSTYGTGLMVKDAIARGKTDLYLLLGGSATNDMGLGIATALGVEFEGATKASVSGSDLALLKSIDLSAKQNLTGVNFSLFCDVTNPVFGPEGAAHVYAKQKGASDEEILHLDHGLQHATEVLQKHTHTNLASLTGGGAAGGIGVGLTALFGAKLQSGFAAIAQLTNLEEHIKWSDVVITGEGQIDNQSLQGKVVGNVVELCKTYKKPCHVVVGHSAFAKTEPLPSGISSISSLTDIEDTVEVCIAEGSRLLKELAATKIQKWIPIN